MEGKEGAQPGSPGALVLAPQTRATAPDFRVPNTYLPGDNKACSFLELYSLVPQLQQSPQAYWRRPITYYVCTAQESQGSGDDS